MKRRALLACGVAALSGCSVLGGDDLSPRLELRNESPNGHEVTVTSGQHALSRRVDSGEILWHDKPFGSSDAGMWDTAVTVSVDGTTVFDQTLTTGSWVERFTVTIEGPADVTVEKFPPRTPYLLTSDEETE